MTRTKISTVALLCALTIGLFAPSVTEAACSYNGYFNSNGKCGVSWQRSNFTDQLYDQRVQLLERQIAMLQELIRQLQSQRDGYWYDDSSSDVDVYTRSAVNIDDTEADLRGQIDLHNEDEAEVYFQYGTSRTNLKYTSDSRTIDDNDSEYFTISIDDLDDGTVYYFRAVGEDENGDRDYGSILSFRTDGYSSTNNDEDPIAITRSAIDIGDDSADLRGTIDMNDFNNGIVFFVYGEDESQVEDVADDFDSYSGVDEDGDDLQKVLVDNDLDGIAGYRETVDNLDDNTDIYFSICVEYENEDNDDVLECGAVLDFETD